jgi:hypothetical protein
VDANPQINSRSGNVSINGQRTSVTQTGRPCTFDFTSSSAQFGAAGGSGSVTVNTLTGCSWRATTNVSWIQVPASTVTSSDALNFQVSANDGGERSGIITVADRQYIVNQSAAPQPPSGSGPLPPPLPDCTPTVTPLTVDVSAATSTQTIQLVLGPTCVWTASSGAPWLTITSGLAGTGSAAVAVSVAANNGPARSGTIILAGQTVTIRQTAIACTFAINPGSQNAPAAGGGGRFTVTAPAGCTWSASKSVPWIDITQATGVGTADVVFNVQANTAPAARSGAITVGGQTFTVTQAAAACSYSLNSSSLNVSVDGGHNKVTVTTAPSCTWTATSGETGVDVANQSGSGTSDVNFNVAANTGAARSTTITVAGQVLTINQAGVPCTYSINPGSLNVPAIASNGQFTVTTQAACTWTATPGAGWVAIVSPQNGNGTGPGDVVYSVQANVDQSNRTTTITVGGQTYTVTQAGAAPPPPCTFAFNPPSASPAAAGGPATFTVTTQTGCNWTPTTTDAWITITNNGSVTGSGDVNYTIEPNATGMARSGAIAVGGQSFAISQAP